MTRYDPQDWRRAGACRSADPDLFFPISASGRSARQVERARQICAGCPVRQPCLDFALEHRGIEGIWGGTTSGERVRAKRATAARRRALTDPKPQAA
jgi:WhiB family redox-sensing transcriptional regulator